MTTYKDPWADAANQAVGALYKHYLTKPSQAEMENERLKTQQLQLDTQMDQRLYDMGGWSGAPAPVQNKLYRDSLGGDSAAAQLFDSYVNKPMQVDAGDTKYIVSGTTGLPMQQYGVGVAPATTVDKENNRLITTPAMPSMNRPNAGGSDIAHLMGSMIQQESGGDPNAVSPVGAQGLTQVMPSTAVDPGYGVPDIFALAEQRGIPVPSYDEEGAKLLLANPDLNVEFGQNYLSAMKQKHGSDELALASYNAGPGAVQQYGGIPPYEETQNYVQNVMAGAGQPQVTDLPTPQGQVDLDNTKEFNLDRGQDDLNNTFASAIHQINEGGAGVMSMKKDIPFFGGQTTAGNLEADLAKLTAKAAVDEIARLKSESKTGGFFGNLSDGERQAVADSQAALRQDMEPKELAYRIMVFQDLKNDIIHGRGKQLPDGRTVPLDFGSPRTGMPTIADVQSAQSPEEIKAMWDNFSKYPVFEGEPPGFMAQALEQRYMELRDGR